MAFISRTYANQPCIRTCTRYSTSMVTSICMRPTSMAFISRTYANQPCIRTCTRYSTSMVTSIYMRPTSMAFITRTYANSTPSIHQPLLPSTPTHHTPYTIHQSPNGWI